ncbi:MAG: FliH/SctL family protein, partial [Myxococcaceae bacterium]
MAIGKVIKSDSGESPGSEARPVVRSGRAGVVNAEVYDAHQKAAEIIESAQVRASEIKEAARLDRERVLAEAREHGRQEG